MVAIFSHLGDPRGRGNYCMPYSLFLSWRLSILAVQEEKKYHNAEFSEELLEAAIKTLSNHQRVMFNQPATARNIDNSVNNSSIFQHARSAVVMPKQNSKIQ
jgi:hypothetical protein